MTRAAVLTLLLTAVAAPASSAGPEHAKPGFWKLKSVCPGRPKETSYTLQADNEAAAREAIYRWVEARGGEQVAYSENQAMATWRLKRQPADAVDALLGRSARILGKKVMHEGLLDQERPTLAILRYKTAWLEAELPVLEDYSRSLAMTNALVRAQIAGIQECLGECGLGANDEIIHLRFGQERQGAYVLAGSNEAASWLRQTYPVTDAGGRGAEVRYPKDLRSPPASYC